MGKLEEFSRITFNNCEFVRPEDIGKLVKEIQEADLLKIELNQDRQTQIICYKGGVMKVVHKTNKEGMKYIKRTRCGLVWIFFRWGGVHESKITEGKGEGVRFDWRGVTCKKCLGKRIRR